MIALTKESLMLLRDVPVKRIDVPEWEGFVFVRQMTAGARSDWETFVRKYESDKEGELVGDNFSPSEFKFKILWLCLSDENGKALFSSYEETVAVLSDRSSEVIDRVWNEAFSFNKLSEEDVKEDAKN